MIGSTRTPFVYWAQDEGSISLRVDIQHAEDVELRLSDDGMLFDFTARSPVTTDENGSVEYSFQLPLFQPVQNKPNVKSHDNRLEVELVKRNKSFWKNGILNATVRKQAHKWLKFDFEKWRDDPADEKMEREEEEAEEGGNGYGGGRKNPYLEEMLRGLEQDQKISMMNHEEFTKRMNLVYATYIFCYNLGMFIIHFCVLSLILFRFVSTPKTKFLHDFWPAHFHTLTILTFAQYLDVLHSLSGLTKGSYKTSLLQVTGRLAILLIINGSSSCTSWSPVFSLMLTYLLSEQFRYPYYALNSIGISIHFITWLRYNAWLLLYPLGLTLEGLILVRSIPDYLHSGTYSIQMPNSLNMTFNFGIFLAIFTVTCFPFIAFTLLKHMHRQRHIKMAEMGKGKRSGKTKKEA